MAISRSSGENSRKCHILSMHWHSSYDTITAGGFKRTFEIFDRRSVFAVPIGDVKAFAEQALELLSDEHYVQYEEVGPEFVRKFRWAEVAGAEFDILAGEAPVIQHMRAPHDE